MQSGSGIRVCQVAGTGIVSTGGMKSVEKMALSDKIVDLDGQ